MVKLTEDMVVARSKGSELYNIKKLNCWGSELTNVSVVRNLPNVEVLSLSVNQISTLEDFQYCTNLQELYIRKNNITDINEVLYLRQIPKLKSLWLADNPCAEFPEYRMTILRALPHLQKLDNVTVEPEDVQKAMVCGLSLPITGSNSREPEPCDNQRRSMSVEPQQRPEPALVNTSPIFQSRQSNGSSQVIEEGHDTPPKVYDEDDEQPQIRRTSTSSQQVDAEVFERRKSSTPYSPQNGLPFGRVKCPRIKMGPTKCPRIKMGPTENGYQNGKEAPSPRRSSQGANPADPETAMESRPYSRSSEYVYETPTSNYSREDNYPSRRPSREQQYRDQSWASDSDGYGRERTYVRAPPQEYASPHQHYPPRPPMQGDVLMQHYDATYRRADQQMETVTRMGSIDRPPNRPYPLRPKTRNANVLSALLCLIKELDYSSLEVAEMAIRCRMEELDD